MAQVDFSNAVLDVKSGETPLALVNYLQLNNRDIYDSSRNRISQATVSILTNTPTKVSILYTGSFSSSGNYFYMAYNASTLAGTFEISNISFSSGDTYSFVIDIETSGNV